MSPKPSKNTSTKSMNSPDKSLVVVVWHDAHSEQSWTSVEELDSDPYVVRTAGYLLPDAKPGHVVIAQSVGPDGALDGVLQIPVGMVQETILVGHPQLIHRDSLLSN